MFDILLAILKRNASEEANTWLDEFLASQRAEFNQRQFYYAFSGATRRFPKDEIVVTNEEREALNQAAEGFQIDRWTVDQLARVSLLVFLSEQPQAVFLRAIIALFETADMREQAAILSAFPALPYPDELTPMAREGLRSNVVDVFDAVALNNPFPAEHFDDEGWNQMVLKCLFIDRPLYKIYRLEQRANPTLAEALSDLAHERWAA
ncbi:MAG: EboA domain-containing protein, partial [Verrucomicrobiota bacterium]